MIPSNVSNDRRWLALSLGLVVLCASIIVVPHLIDSFPLPKSEDLEYTTVPSIIWAEQLRSGGAYLWNWSIGLGTPWPMPMGLGYSPLAPLLAVLKPLTATAIIVWCHIVAMGAAALWLCRHFGIDRRLYPVCLVSAMLAPHLEYLYASDSLTVLLGSLCLPVVFALLISILDDERGRILKGVALGVAAALLLKEGHPGVTSTYVVAIGIFLLLRWRPVLRALPFLILAFAIALISSFAQLFQLFTESSLFSPETPRYQEASRGFFHTVWGLFIHPLALRPFEANMLVRTVSFGPVFALLVVFFTAKLYRREHLRPYVITFWVCTVSLFVPALLLPAAISAIYPVRDLANLLGILLAGIALTTILAADEPRKVRLAVRAQLILVIVGAIPLLAGGTLIKSRGIFLTKQYNELVDRDSQTPYIRTLREAIGAGTGLDARFIATSLASRMMDIEMMVDQGAVNNVAIVHGLTEVSFIAKGMSFDAIQRGQTKPYGVIAGDRYREFSYVPGEDDWPRDDQALLTFLGIRAVVAEAKETPKAPALIKMGTLRGRDGFALTVYKNTQVLPAAFIVPPDILDAPRINRPDCNYHALVCRDVSGIVSAARPEGITVSLAGDQISLSTPKLSSAALMLVTAMYRPGWSAVDQDGNALKLESWSGIWRLEIPPGTSRIDAKFSGYRYPWSSASSAR